LRQAAAQARRWLLDEAARALGLTAESVDSIDGQACAVDGRRILFGTLVAGRHVELMLDPTTPLKAATEHRVVGTSVPRVDIPAKVAGDAVFVHDVRVPGMLHGRVVRPPYAGVDAGDFVGRTLLGVDESSIAHLAGVRQVVVIGDFVGVVAEREDQAEAAMHALRVQWKPWPALPPLADLAHAIRANPSTARVVSQQGDVDAARASAATPIDREYVWPYQLHAAIGPSCAVADWQNEALTVWAGTQNPHVLRADLAKLTGLADTAVDVIRLEASGCYGRNGADDVAADAALLSRAVGAPVRVQLTREQEHAWEPKGAAQLMQVRGGLDGSSARWPTTSPPRTRATRRRPWRCC
jgi:nicotinate dehydrogenase subunit B